MVWLWFVVCVLLVLYFGSKLSRYGDIIAEKTGLGGVWIGFLLMAAVTSLPELVTGISAVTLVGGGEGANLSLGAVFGSNLFNLLIIGLMDVMYRSTPLFGVVSRGHRQLAALSILIIAFAGISVLLGTEVWDGALGWISIYSIVLIVLFLWASRRIFRFEREQETKVGELQYEAVTKRKAYLNFSVAALAIVGAGIWLAVIGDGIAEATGWGTTFVGSLFVAATTSLPELVVSVAAIRIAAVDMAVANMLGSNMFNMGVVIFGNDLFYRSGSIFADGSKAHIITAAVAVLMTLVVVAGLTFPFGRRMRLGVSWHSVALAAIYLAGAYILFTEPWR